MDAVANGGNTVGVWTLTLTPDEHALARHLAEIRQERNRANGVSDKRMSDRPGIEEDGFTAELAVCKHYNVWPELDSRSRKGGHDCVIRDYRVDVKSEPEPKPWLYLPERKRLNWIDLYVWCVVRGPVVSCQGWASPAALFHPEYLEQSPRPDERHYKVPASVLCPTAAEALDRAMLPYLRAALS